VSSEREERLTILLPTLNEAGNIGPLIDGLRAALAPLAPEILVLDGDSADGTADEARARGATVISDRGGYARALELGFSRAAGDWLLVLDADGSHRAQDALALWTAREGCDLVVGSRRVAGAATAQGLVRRALSGLLARLFAAFARLPARDISSGFRLYRLALFRPVALKARFFEVQPELLALARARGARVREVPIHYEPRGKGASKARVLRYGLAFLAMLWRLRRG
jgi:dolichol-phosphate mannosyltransferase